MIEETERIDRLIGESDALNAAFLTNAAVNDPKLLEQRQSAFLGKLRRDPEVVPPARPSPEALHRAAQDIFSRIKLRETPARRA